MASIEDQAANDFIANTILRDVPDLYHQVFIGGVYIATEEQWEWDDGSAFGYTNWASNTLDGGNEDCVTMLMKNGSLNVRGKWQDVSCTQDDWLPFICSISLD